MSEPTITVVTYLSEFGATWTLTRTDGVVTQIESVFTSFGDEVVDERNFDPLTGLPVLEEQPLMAPISRVETSSDDGDVRRWQTEERAFDADGNLLRTTRELDDGTVLARFEQSADQTIIYRADPSDVAGWSIRSETRDSVSNALESSWAVRDDDVYVFSVYYESGMLDGRAWLDLGDAYAWSERALYYNEDTTISVSYFRKDNGIATARYFDDDGNLSTRFIQDTADIRAFEFIKTEFADDGGRTVTTGFDDGRFMERIFDAEGVLRSRSIWDAEDAYAFERIDATYDENGTLIDRIVTPDPVADDMLF